MDNIACAATAFLNPEPKKELVNEALSELLCDLKCNSDGDCMSLTQAAVIRPKCELPLFNGSRGIHRNTP